MPEPELGAVVDVMQPDGRWIARGLYNPLSRLKVRLYTWNAAETIDEGFLLQRIASAIRRRTPLDLEGDEQSVRLVFSEADGLSGLIVDRYGPFLVVQFTAAAMYHRRDAILAGLVEQLRPQGVLVRIDQQTAKVEGMVAGDEVSFGRIPEEAITISEKGLKYEVNLRQSQKTGLYLDQRDNREAAARYLRGKKVLDICCYVGGFSLSAARLGGAEVLGIDASAWAVEQATRNASLNQLSNVRFEVGDMFDTLTKLGEQGAKFDGVILDPPRLAGSRENVASALRAYERLNRAALRLLPAGGILITCSCSGRVQRPEFLHMLQETGRRLGRDLMVLESRAAAPDHPVNLSCPETDYLKCVIAEAS